MVGRAGYTAYNLPNGTRAFGQVECERAWSDSTRHCRISLSLALCEPSDREKSESNSGIIDSYGMQRFSSENTRDIADDDRRRKARGKHTGTSGPARDQEENTLMQHIHAKHEIARNYLAAPLAYPVRLGVLLGVPAELEDSHEDRQS